MKPSDLWVAAGMGLLFGLTIGLIVFPIVERNSIEKKCIYENRVEFSGQMFSCQWLPEVTTTDKQYDVKPHPNKEVMK